jgi:hypothetical protein
MLLKYSVWLNVILNLDDKWLQILIKWNAMNENLKLNGIFLMK